MKSSGGKLSDMERMKRELNAALPLPAPNARPQPAKTEPDPQEKGGWEGNARQTATTDLTAQNPGSNQVDDYTPSRSYSLYMSDHERLDAIRDRLKPFGIRKLNDSLALRLCVRFVSESEGATKRLVELHEILKAQDGRRKRRQSEAAAKSR